MKLRITFLSRTTMYRKILNEEELLKRISSYPSYEVQKVNFGKEISFENQLKITSNTDIFVGIHGAGLTHLLFLPKWATIFEIYNCEDPNCYKDLARLRGVHYVTWENDSLKESIKSDYEDGTHEKFNNFKFDVDEFERLVKKSANTVLENQEYQFFKQKARSEKHEEL